MINIIKFILLAIFQARGSMLMFVASFLTFMAIGGFPSFVEEMKVSQLHTFIYQICIATLNYFLILCHFCEFFLDLWPRKDKWSLRRGSICYRKHIVLHSVLASYLPCPGCHCLLPRRSSKECWNIFSTSL